MAAEVMKRDVNGCPELEAIAAFLDRRLGDSDRAEIAGHLSSCETCYFVFSEAAQVKPTATTGTTMVAASWWRSNRVMWPAAAAGLAAAATLALAVSGLLPMGRSSAPELTALVAAVGTDRTIEPRLTGGFAHGRFRGPVRSSEIAQRDLTPDVRIAAAVIEKETGSQRSAEALHVRGVALLVIGEVERAVATLENASSLHPTDASILSDLAAAYLVSAERGNRAEDLRQALAVTNRAIAAERGLAEAWYNRAFAFDRLALPREARDAWQTYLTLDQQSGWAEEARARLAALDTAR